jgi:hypothetical protein
MLCYWSPSASGQTGTVVITGKVIDKSGDPLDAAEVFIQGSQEYIFTDRKGRYSIEIPARTAVVLIARYIESFTKKNIDPLEAGSEFVVNFTIKTTKTFDDAVVKGVIKKNTGVITLKPIKTARFPTTRFEQVLTVIGLGVNQSGGELSSAYNVRGGNFNENLVYVNDIEVYRPFLVRSGQQEGLSFVNPDMVDYLTFSAGGFSAKYGDKLASVLDVKYKQPTEFNATLTTGFMNNGIHIENRIGPRLSFIVGARYRTTRLLLNSLDVAGSYQPKAYDFQSYLTYRFNSQASLSWLSTASNNDFILEPESRETSFGTVQNAFKLFVAFDGAEQMSYSTWLNGLAFEYKFDSANSIKLISSYYTTSEKEHFTVEGGYRLDQLENNLGSNNFGGSRNTLGIGYFINHARNDLDAQVINHKIMGKHILPKGKLEWGAKYQEETIDDVLREWDYNDSAGHNITQTGHDEDELVLDNFLNSKVHLNSYRIMGYIEHSFHINQRNELYANFGLRSNYWSLNGENVISPRARISFRPNKIYNDAIIEADSTISIQKYDSLKKRNWLIKAAAGYYYQPAFYRELRDPQGVINKDLKAQRSIHFVAGGDMDFKAWDRPFRFIGEVYYKKMDRIVPYYLDDVRIRYSAQNASEAYAAGIDARINGEFIKGLESWVNLSLLQTKERITYEDSKTGQTTTTQYLRRPTDQLFTFSVLFSDELPSDSTFKMHLNMVYSSGLPYYFGGDLRYIENWTIPAYRRVDIGFSKVIFEGKGDRKRFKNVKSLWLGLEVFNLLQINNTVSYIWVSDVQNNVYGIPNHLTGRRLNLRLIMRF